MGHRRRGAPARAGPVVRAAAGGRDPGRPRRPAPAPAGPHRRSRRRSSCTPARPSGRSAGRSTGSPPSPQRWTVPDAPVLITGSAAERDLAEAVARGRGFPATASSPAATDLGAAVRPGRPRRARGQRRHGHRAPRVGLRHAVGGAVRPGRPGPVGAARRRAARRARPPRATGAGRGSPTSPTRRCSRSASRRSWRRPRGCDRRVAEAAGVDSPRRTRNSPRRRHAAVTHRQRGSTTGTAAGVAR